MKKVLALLTIAILLSLTSFYSYVFGDRYSSNQGIDWMQMCGYVEQALYEPCSEYVDDDGDLTYAGERAFGCIRNGALLGGGALTLGVPLGFITKGLEVLAGPTGCDGIVDFQILNNLGGLGTVLNIIN